MLTSPDEKYLAVLGSGDTAVSIISLETFEFIDKLSTPGLMRPDWKECYGGQLISIFTGWKISGRLFYRRKTFVFNVGTWTLAYENVLPDNLGYSRGAFVNFSADGKYMVVNSRC